MNNSSKTIKLVIRSRSGVLFQGDVSSLSSVNQDGKFDVLQNHANFISVVFDKIVYRDAITNVSHDIPIGRAVLQAVENNVRVFIGL